MKSIKDLEAIRQRTLDEVNLRNDRHGIRVVVGMGTCGISAGARPVMMEFVEEIKRRGAKDENGIHVMPPLGPSYSFGRIQVQRVAFCAGVWYTN